MEGNVVEVKKIILTGGPCTGKTTVLNAYREKYDTPSTVYVDEPAQHVIEHELFKAGAEEGYEAITPASNYPAFYKLAIDASQKLEADIPPHAELAILDRSLIDNIAYARLNEHADTYDLQNKIRLARYAGAVVCAPVGAYENTVIRHEDATTAENIHHALLDAYNKSDIPVYHLPLASVDERVERLREIIRREFGV